MPIRGAISSTSGGNSAWYDEKFPFYICFKVVGSVTIFVRILVYGYWTRAVVFAITVVQRNCNKKFTARIETHYFLKIYKKNISFDESLLHSNVWRSVDNPYQRPRLMHVNGPQSYERVFFPITYEQKSCTSDKAAHIFLRKKTAAGRLYGKNGELIGGTASGGSTERGEDLITGYCYLVW